LGDLSQGLSCHWFIFFSLVLLAISLIAIRKSVTLSTAPWTTPLSIVDGHFFGLRVANDNLECSILCEVLHKHKVQHMSMESPLAEGVDYMMSLTRFAIKAMNIFFLKETMFFIK
jgi:hypothetical protein